MFKHILVPVAPGHEKEYSESIDAARKLLAEGGRISILSIMEELPSYMVSYFPKDQFEKASKELSGTLTEEFGSDVDIHVVSGHTTNTILNWQEKHKADCVVVSSHRPGLSDLLLGSTAARVVRHSNCSVVVLR
ncbi:Universal stress protein F [Ruegeria denitrificans]|uniref:Universal stress protein F n=1 Tax=Ruegeria denitrificans TaxID=1715692 RepID=A0A0P1IK46_9RHOB|nr:universal stress protein [Ruegeria denitrificans]CUK18932.1 Universal stress protein F [Ruegeria denitrificans]